MNPQIKIKLLPGGRMPERAHPTDACFDVWAADVKRDCSHGNHYMEYGLGFATEIPEGWVGYFYPRSSISNYDLVLCNSIAVIDAGFRGEWLARFRVTKQTFAEIYRRGDRIGQIRFAPLPAYELVQADELSDTPRGAGGFGSTGQQ